MQMNGFLTPSSICHNKPIRIDMDTTILHRQPYSAPVCEVDELVFSEFILYNTETIGGKDNPDNDW